MITLTKNAAKEIRKIKNSESLEDNVPIRIGVKAGGCSGFTYTFDFDSRKTRFDIEFQSQEMTILVDKKSHLYIDGTSIDWSYNLADYGLRFTNPAAKGSCGCSTSFIFDPSLKETDVPVLDIQF